MKRLHTASACQWAQLTFIVVLIPPREGGQFYGNYYFTRLLAMEQISLLALSLPSIYVAVAVAVVAKQTAARIAFVIVVVASVVVVAVSVCDDFTCRRVPKIRKIFNRCSLSAFHVQRM